MCNCARQCEHTCELAHVSLRAKMDVLGPVCVCVRAHVSWVTVYACLDKRVTKSPRFVSFGDWVCVCVNIRCVRAFPQA